MSQEDLQREAHRFLDMGQVDEARASMTRAIDLDPNDAELHALMAWCTEKCRSLPPQERDRLSAHHLNVSLEIAPANVHAHYWQGRIWMERGQPVPARAALEAALSAKPDSKPAVDALEILKTGSTPARVAPAIPGGPPGRGKRRRTRPALIVVTVLSFVAAAAFHLIPSSEQRGLARLRMELGTSLVIETFGKAGKELHLVIAGQWSDLAPHEKETEIQKIAVASQGIGFPHVFLHHKSNIVAEGHDGVTCIDEKCGPIANVTADPGNTQTARVESTAAPGKK